MVQLPDGPEVRGSAGKLGEGLDIRGAGGYVIVPPSVHETGRTYRWADPEQSIADAPSWLLDLLSDTTAKLKKTPAHDPSSLWASAMMG